MTSVRLFAATIGFTIDPTANNSPINPYSYGANSSVPYATGDPITNTLYRSGGNRLTAYNWENNASNSGTDYCQSVGSTICSHEDSYMFPTGVNNGNNQPATTLTDFILGNKAQSADSLITLQAAGYVSADPACNCFVTITSTADTSHTYWKAVSYTGGPSSGAPVTTDNVVYMDEEMHYLVSKVGDSGSGGAKFYCLDNEPALWVSTHPMSHPTTATCAEVSSNGISLATVITSIDPGAQILGPVAYGWGEYTNNQSAPDAGILTTYNNGNYIPYLNYYLHQMNVA
jgi:hypothetical protein